ncbi:MAG TPA: EAL domain-containing protein [Terracidiphilus sp.]|jgi:diguanylate cyclase (GGDEF)-like protein/PAS domain S-box-containing protein
MSTAIKRDQSAEDRQSSEDVPSARNGAQIGGKSSCPTPHIASPDECPGQKHRDIEESLRQTMASLQETQRIGGLGSYELDISTGRWTSSDVTDDIFGIGKGYERTVPGWEALIHPDDRQMMRDHFFCDVIGQGKPFNKEYRIIRYSDKTERWVHGIGKLALDGGGRPVSMRGIIRNITERKLAEERLNASEQRYRASFEQAAVGMLHTSLEGRIENCNEHFARMLGYSVDEIRGITFQQITAPEDLVSSNRVLERMAPGAADAAGVSVWEKRYVRKDGTLTWVKLTVSLQRDASGVPIHYITVVEDINARKATELRLATALTDLKTSEERYRTTFQMSTESIAINRVSDGIYIDVNKAFLNISGYQRDEVIGRSSLELDIWANLDERFRLLESVRANSVCRDIATQFRHKDGTLFWGSLSGSIIRINEDDCLLTVTRDITTARMAEEKLADTVRALSASEERYRTVFATCSDGILINEIETGKCIDVNQSFLETTGYQRHEVVGKAAMDLGLWIDYRDRSNMMQKLRRNGTCRGFEARFRKKDGTTIWGMLSATVTEIDGVRCLISITRDNSDAKAAEGEIINLAFYDQLTGLPNRRLLLERLRQSLSPGSGNSHKRALLFIDLDNFKNLNDTLGHQTGDLMLQEVARRLGTCVRQTDTVARLGGDEFVVMLEDLCNSPSEAATQVGIIGEKMRAALELPYWLSGRECLSSCSIGITVFGDKRESTNEVLQQADIAMYHAKAAGRNTLRFFAPALQTAVNARSAMEEELRQGIRDHQFVLHYQPQVDSTRVIGAEALVRWNHPKRGLLNPGEFISLAEDSGLILPLGDWVFESVCTQIAAWDQRTEAAQLTVAVNISVRQFRQPNFVEHVLEVLDRTGAKPHHLVMELTERLLVDDFDEVIARMSTLQGFGLRFALDDFGTGYSSLNYLRLLPLHQLKIDRSFVRDMMVDSTSGAIAQTIVSLGRAMDLPVLAEGVEMEAQRDFLLSLGCHSFQGYLFSRPLPLREFELFLLERIATPPATIE